MTPILSKLTMCVCAAGTGAAVVPTAHAVQRHFSPHHAVRHAVRAPAIEAATARPDCLPGVTTAGGGLGEGGGGSLISLSPAAAGTPIRESGGFPFGGFAPVPGNGGGGGGPIGGNAPGDNGPGSSVPGIPSSPGIPSLPGTPASPGTPSGPGIPSISNAPEPASWMLMVAGFGLAGGAIRYRRVVPA